jgi:hypothetical protein
MPTKPLQEWLLIFYSVPSHPVSNRMKIWRKLAKAGAVQFKGAVYILPATEENEEFLQWLISEVKSMKGDAAFVKSAEIRPMDNADIRDLFLKQVEQEYRRFEKDLDVLERRFQSIRKGTKAGDAQGLADQAVKAERALEEIQKRDYFLSPAGGLMRKRVQALEAGLKKAGGASAESPAEVKRRGTDEFQNRTWVTRKNPFIDRMASAWLIRRFIDGKAMFKFVNERAADSADKNAVLFDMQGGDFTHVGDLCTFEVMVKSFGIRDKAVRKIAEIVHDLDVRDNKYGKPEAAGIEEILAGIRKTARNDADGLERGMAAFEMLYQSKT